MPCGHVHHRLSGLPNVWRDIGWNEPGLQTPTIGVIPPGAYVREPFPGVVLLDRNRKRFNTHSNETGGGRLPGSWRPFPYIRR